MLYSKMHVIYTTKIKQFYTYTLQRLDVIPYFHSKLKFQATTAANAFEENQPN